LVKAVQHVSPVKTAGSFFPAVFSLPMAKEKPQQAWKDHPTAQTPDQQF